MTDQQQQTQPPQSKSGQGRRRKRNRNKHKVVDLWRPVPQLPDPEPVVPASDPAALLRSLGDPPLQGQGAAEHYLAAAVERAAMVATALATSADLIAQPEPDE